MKNAVAQAHAEKQPFKTGSMPVKSRYVKDAQVAANGEVVVVLVPAVGNGGSIVLTPSIDPAGTMSWSCSGNGVPPRYLPATCR
jgi:type IV pilus assembly protein PilA